MSTTDSRNTILVDAKDRKLLYPKVIWLDFGISQSKDFLD